MIYGNNYGYQQRAERLRDYAPEIDHSTALMQARFEAHDLGKPRTALPSSVSEPEPDAAPATDDTADTIHQPSES